MPIDARELDAMPLGDLLRRRLRLLFDRLGSHHAPDLHRRVMDEVERALIEEALERADGLKQEAAAILGIHRNTLRQKIRTLRISNNH